MKYQVSANVKKVDQRIQNDQRVKKLWMQTKKSLLTKKLHIHLENHAFMMPGQNTHQLKIKN